jgi:chromosomal replication initiator protein
MYLTRKITDASLVEIGRYFGGRHHTTVMHPIMRIEEQRGSKDGVEVALRIIVESINR